MFKIKKKIIFFLTVTFLIASCGYTPQYGKNKNFGFSLNLIDISGDRDFNNALRTKLNAYDNNKERNFKISAKSKYEKKIILKDSLGAAKDELKITTNFEITYKDKKKDLKLIETFKMEKIDDAFEESNYEKSVKSNFAEIITEKLVNYLFLIKWS